MPLSDQLRIEIADILLFHGRKVALALQVLRPSESSSIAESTNPVTLTQMIVLFQSILPHLGLTVVRILPNRTNSPAYPNFR